MPDAGKLSDDEKYEQADSVVDSGFISSGNLMLSGDVSEEIIPKSSGRSAPRHQADSGIIEDNEHKTRDSSMHIDSGVYLPSELSLSEKISKLNLESGLNDLNNPKTIQPPVAADSPADDDDIPWKIYFEQDEDGDTHLHAAIFHRCVEVALALIRSAPHPRLLDTPNDSAQTPLHLAVETAQYQIVRWLIVAGAKPSPRDAQGDSPLHIAARMGDLNCIKAIVEPVQPKHVNAMSLGYLVPNYEKCHLNQWNYLGQTCVHVAAMHKQLDVLRHLVSYGADVNAREGLEGFTALHYAVQNGDKNMLKYLLMECHTLKPDIRTYGGRNALQLSFVLPADIRQTLKLKGLDSPYSSEEEDSSDEEMAYDTSPAHRFLPNLVNASA
ncbi:hypothetical protein GWI33_014282 [Rhynchophorus ferrugineus]|uniref:NF-kappa-B inhibitor cactus n=1 Tax=Rhynchophorus ferrugineus TaxID=354439 RepID=A0A834M714_RHYFE|nr:hypothetical protein GWI33_014282 [Rhynchophorus ferrugineus]